MSICQQNILRSRVNISADETTFYGSTTKSLADQRLAADLSSDRARIVQQEAGWTGL